MPNDDDIASAILTLCMARGVGKTICPSEAARDLAAANGDWRVLMPDVRRVARTLAESGRVAILSRGQVRTDHDTDGIIRIGLPRDP